MLPLVFLESVLAQIVAAREAVDVDERDAILEGLEHDVAVEIERTPIRYCLGDFGVIDAGPEYG